MSYKKKWVSEGVETGYISAMLSVISFVAESQNNDLDIWITEFSLRKTDFLKYWGEEDLDFVDECYLTPKALEIWLS